MMTVEQAIQFMQQLGLHISVTEQHKQQLKNDLLQSRHPELYKSDDVSVVLCPDVSIFDRQREDPQCFIRFSFLLPVLVDGIAIDNEQIAVVRFERDMQFVLYATNDNAPVIQSLLSYRSFTTILRTTINFGYDNDGYRDISVAYVLRLYSHQKGVVHLVLIGRHYDCVFDVHYTHVCASLHDAMLYLDDYLNRTFSV